MSGGVLSSLSTEAQAALRRFSVERLMAYGLTYSDAIELQGRVSGGESWQSVAEALASECLASAKAARTSATKVNLLFRASAS